MRKGQKDQERAIAWKEKNSSRSLKADPDTHGKRFIRKGRPTLIVPVSSTPFRGNLKETFKFGAGFDNKDRKSKISKKKTSVEAAQSIQNKEARKQLRKNLWTRFVTWVRNIFKKGGNK